MGGKKTQGSTTAANSRKRSSLECTSSSEPTPQKKPKITLIDDVVALSVFRELNCTDDFLNSGKVLAWALQPDDPAFLMIHDYISRGQEHGYGIKVLSIIRIIPRASDLIASPAAPLDFNEDPEADGKLRMMLWHGTRAAIVPSILENGLQIPPVRGQMFGTGIYFADRISKSVNYCGAKIGGSAYIFLSDVLLGNVYHAKRAMPGRVTAPITYDVNGNNIVYDSIRGCGRDVPDKSWNVEIDGVVWPVGPTIKNRDDGYDVSLLYNEYIVYNPKQVQPKYLVKVGLTPKPVHEAIY